MSPAVDAADDELAERRLALMLEHIARVRWQMVAALVFVVVLVWSTVPTVPTLIWGATVPVGREVRVFLLRRLTQDRRLPVRIRLRRAVWLSLAAGLPQGAAAGFMFWLDRAQNAVLTMILVSICAGAVSTTALVRGAFMVYGSCLLIPAALFWFASFDRFGIGIAALMLMFLGVQNRFARDNRRTFEESFRIRRENDELVRQLAEARDRAEAASRAKTRFLAAASHDLRQPLHALSLQSAALTLDPGAADSPRLVRAMSRSIEDLSALLDSLLDISKLDAGTMRADRRPIQLSRLVHAAAHDFRALAEAKGLRFDLECPPGLVACTDPLLLERLLRNLIDNAVKYTTSGGVTVSLGADDDGMLIRVRDTGCGIPAELQSRVFEEFYQIDGTARAAARGLGLGLSIVRRLADLLDIALRLESAPGRGTCVSVQLPRALDAARGVGVDVGLACEDRTPIRAAQLEGLHVLVIDDEPAVRDATAALLARLGCSVDVAGDGDAAVAALVRRAADVVVTDYRLRDGETGIGLVPRLRGQQPGLPVLLISGDTAPDRLREAAASGLPLLHKPLAAEQLHAAIAAAVTGEPDRSTADQSTAKQ